MSARGAGGGSIEGWRTPLVRRIVAAPVVRFVATHAAATRREFLCPAFGGAGSVVARAQNSKMGAAPPPAPSPPCHLDALRLRPARTSAWRGSWEESPQLRDGRVDLLGGVEGGVAGEGEEFQVSSFRFQVSG